uniref:MMPL family transporter n=1 Tax=Clostridium sp. NkU-1 TaxID=1095009 RepID=UPI0006D0B9CC
METSLSAYLPDDTETRIGLDVMEEEFVTFGMADVMVANISYPQAEEILQKIETVPGVSGVVFNDSSEHYTNASALYQITFAYDEKEEACLAALDAVKEDLAGYDFYVSTTMGDTLSETIASEMKVIVVIVAILVLAILLLTSETYAEVAVLIATFLSAAIINMGTNFLFGTISFVSNSVTIVLQLALSIDYAVILCNRFKEEHEILPTREAVIVALSKAIPEISASSLTTVGGLLAMTFMQFEIGVDMGMVLIKAIILSLFSVFVVMPGLLVLFSNLMEKTKHKKLIPPIPFVGRIAYKTRFVVPPVFLVLAIVAMVISGKCPYVYGYSQLTTPILNESQIAEQMIEENFGKDNVIAMIVPSGDYAAEGKLLAELETRPEIDYALGLSNTEAMDGYMLTGKLTPRQFSELTDLDYEEAEVLYAAYAIDDESYGKIVGGLSAYSVPLIDMFMFLYDEVQEGYITLEPDLQKTLDDAYIQMRDGRVQLEGENYSRILISINLPEEGEETFAFLDEMHNIAGKYYQNEIYLAGDSTSQYDLYKSFQRDNTVVTVVSILIVLAVLLFTFKSAGMPVLLIMVIQGSIWLNFSFPALTQSPLFFMSYLIVSSIQMGANIDYAIVISSRYMELTERMSPKEAIIETMNLSFPTIITSGSMLAISGILIGQLTSEPAIVGIGQSLGRGTLLSIFLVMFILPQLLLFGDRIIRKTSFSVSVPIPTRSVSGYVRVDGRIHGQVSGTITGTVHGVIKGKVDALVQSGEVKEMEAPAEQEDADNE